jgi:hypothetical protein
MWEFQNTLKMYRPHAIAFELRNLMNVNIRSMMGLTKCSSPGILLNSAIPKTSDARKNTMVLMTIGSVDGGGLNLAALDTIGEPNLLLCSLQKSSNTFILLMFKYGLHQAFQHG